MNATKPSVASLLLLLLVGVMLSGCSAEKSSQPPAPETVRNLPVSVVQRATLPDVNEAVGTVRSVQSSQLASQMMGTIVEIRVQAGDHVRRGQVLATIDDSQPRAALERVTAAESSAAQDLASAESDLNLAEITFKRYQSLYDRKSVSPQEFDEVKARYQNAVARREVTRAGQAQAKAAVSQARTAFTYARILAPFDGVITERKVDPGALASPGFPIFTIEDVGRYRLEVTINENDLHDVHMGESVQVVVDAFRDSELKGSINQIVPAADPSSRSFLVKVELPSDPRLRSGLFGRARFPRGERSSLLIPQTAVVARGQLQGIFVLDANGLAALRYVTVGQAHGKEVEVLAGLEAGERLIANPGSVDFNGKRIEAP